MKKESGQVVILLLLIMVVALAIGLSTIGRSILEVSTSRKSEDSSRAFSAAEAGIERAIKQYESNIGATTIDVNPISGLSNQAGASIQGNGLPVGNNALNFTAFTKRGFAQFWLANPDNTSVRGYTGNSFDIFFGDPDNNGLNLYDKNDPVKLANQPAIEVAVIYWDGSKYQDQRLYYDSFKDISGNPAPRSSNFSSCDIQYSGTPGGLTEINVDDGNTKVTYYCGVIVNFASFTPPLNNSGSTFPIIVRVRLLYTELAHPAALRPSAVLQLPKQANIYSSKGTSGEVSRTLEVKNYRAVMPQLFDYVIFSASSLTKSTI